MKSNSENALGPAPTSLSLTLSLYIRGYLVTSINKLLLLLQKLNTVLYWGINYNILILLMLCPSSNHNLNFYYFKQI